MPRRPAVLPILLLGALEIGQQVKVTVMSDGRRTDLEVTLQGI